MADPSVKRKLCRELPREKGEAFEAWLKEMIDASYGEGDEDASWAETFQGNDPRVAVSSPHRLRSLQGEIG